MQKLILSLAMAMLSLTAYAQKRTPFFVQISDPQLGFISKSDDFSPEKELMQQITNKVNSLRPDFVVFSGDLVHYGSSKTALEGFQQMCKAFDADIPLYFVPGNHDVENNAPAENVAAFVERYGHDRFVHKAKRYTVIGYNSCVIKAATPAEAEEYAWIEKALQKARRNKPIILIAHHPMFLSSPDEPEVYENIPPVLREKYLKLFEQYGVDLVLAGHLHKCAQGEYQGIKFVTAGPAGRTLGKDKSGIEIIKVDGGKAVATYYEIGNIPQSIK